MKLLNNKKKHRRYRFNRSLLPSSIEQKIWELLNKFRRKENQGPLEKDVNQSKQPQEDVVIVPPIIPNVDFEVTNIKRILAEDAKLTIILVENTEEVAREKEKIEKIVKSLVTTGYICVINYGSSVRESETVEAKSFNSSELLSLEDLGDTACLFDALIALESVVDKKYKNVEELENKKIRISRVEVIGIGRCIDNCSTSSIETGIESFCRVARRDDVITKYFCLSEESFIAAATIGFRSIGAIARNYM